MDGLKIAVVGLRTKIQYAGDNERAHFCINFDCIDNELYCSFNEFQTISPIEL